MILKLNLKSLSHSAALFDRIWDYFVIKIYGPKKTRIHKKLSMTIWRVILRFRLDVMVIQYYLHLNISMS